MSLPIGLKMVYRTALVLATVPSAFIVSCAPTPSRRQTPTSLTPQAAAPIVHCDPNDQPIVSLEPVQLEPSASAMPPLPAGVVAIQTSALHNVFKIGPKMLSGAGAGSRADFDELASLGIKTILSVDGAMPDLQAASSRGMGYVHIPLTYADITRSQQLQIARAVRDLPGPIYIHCHHGKHRGPAAAASAAVLLGQLTQGQAVAFMKHAGTAPAYKGLYETVAAAMVATAVEIESTAAEIPPMSAPAGLTMAMVRVDRAYENLGLIRSAGGAGAGWAVPADHPDLVPASEAGQLADHLRLSGEDSKAKEWGAKFEEMLASAVGHATALEIGLVAGKGKAELEALWKPVIASCRECHGVYRDVRRP